MEITALGKLLILLGIGILVLGLLLLGLGQVPFFGKLPGDIRIEREGFSCFAPIASMILISLLLSIALNVIARIVSR
jgi:hypothetical protein